MYVLMISLLLLSLLDLRAHARSDLRASVTLSPSRVPKEYQAAPQGRDQPRRRTGASTRSSARAAASAAAAARQEEAATAAHAAGDRGETRAEKDALCGSRFGLSRSLKIYNNLRRRVPLLTSWPVRRRSWAPAPQNPVRRGRRAAWRRAPGGGARTGRWRPRSDQSRPRQPGRPLWVPVLSVRKGGLLTFLSPFPSSAPLRACPIPTRPGWSRSRRSPTGWRANGACASRNRTLIDNLALSVTTRLV